MSTNAGWVHTTAIQMQSVKTQLADFSVPVKTDFQEMENPAMIRTCVSRIHVGQEKSVSMVPETCSIVFVLMDTRRMDQNASTSTNVQMKKTNPVLEQRLVLIPKAVTVVKV